MSKLSKLLQVTAEEKKAIISHYNITEEEFEDNVNRLKEWLDQSEHLPKENDDNKLKVCLLNSKMSLEKAKQSIEGYYRVRALYSEEVFAKMLPNTKEYEEAKNFVITVIMPKLTPNLCRITIFKISDPLGEADNAYLYELLALMMAEIRISYDYFLSNTLVVDFNGYGWKNMIKYTPSINQKLVNILNAVNLRIHSVHFVNIPPFIDQILRIIKSVLPNKIVHKIHLHKSYESLHEHIPREYLPINYGGTEKSIEDLYEDWCEQIEESEDMFKRLVNVKSTEKIELDPTQQEMFGCGVEGSFKKLVID